jgi:hypothetical protein
MDSASSYLQEKKFEHLAKDLTGLVRSYPIPSVSWFWLFARPTPEINMTNGLPTKLKA